MNNLIKSMLVIVLVATAAGCSIVDRGHALYDANPAAYDAMPGSNAQYFEHNPQYNQFGS